MINIIRFSLAFTFFALSLLAVFRAPTNLLWKLSIAVTEFNFICLLIFAVPLAGSWSGNLNRCTVILSIAAIILTLSPVLRAYLTEKEVSAVSNHFSGKSSATSLLNLGEMMFGKTVPETKISTYNYSEGLLMDFYPSSSSGKSPCILVIHGGGWDSGSKDQFLKWNHYLASRGYHVAAINYHLAPQFHFPRPSEDAIEAINYVKSKADELNIDTNHIFLMGRSAGGQIALDVAYKLKYPALKGVIAFYAPADMVWGYFNPGSKLILDSKLVMEQYLGGTYSEKKEAYHASSPLETVSSGCPPTLLIHGVKDEMVSYLHSTKLKTRLDELEVKSLLISIPWGTHGCDYNFSGPSSQLCRYGIESFLECTQ